MKLKHWSIARLKKYKRNPNRCPKCNSDDLVSGRFEYEEGGGYVPVECHKCGLEWDDLYTMTGAGERSFSEIPEDLTIKKDTEVCVEFSIKGVGWGQTLEEAWEACMEGLDLRKMDAKDAHPSIIEERKIEEETEELNKDICAACGKPILKNGKECHLKPDIYHKGECWESHLGECIEEN